MISSEIPDLVSGAGESQNTTIRRAIDTAQRPPSDQETSREVNRSVLCGVAMSTLTVAENKGPKRPQYKDYVTFLGSYKSGGRKDDQCSVATNDSGVSFSLSNSTNNSSSSINSDLTDCPAASRNGFKDYLEQYSHKKYSSVQPAFIKKQGDRPEDAKTVKTEVYIEINGAQAAPSQVTKVIEINNVQTSASIQSSNVSKVSKIFERNNSFNEPVKTVPPCGKVNTFKFDQKESDRQSTASQDQKKGSIGEISKKFESQASNGLPHKVPLKKTPSINEKTKLFEEGKKNSFNEVSKTFQQKDDFTASKINGSAAPKPPVNTIKPVLAPKTFTETSNNPPSSLTVQQSTIPVPPPPPQSITFPPSPPPIHNLPPPPPPPQNLPPPPPPPQTQNLTSNVPPPPPQPPANFAPRHSLPKMSSAGQNGRQKDHVDGVQVPVIDKNDPRVKRMVYGALREMYGAYHDKANDYIATLPRNRVKKNNGLDSIINSIASQGGLEKLNGRVNPSVENE